MPRVDAGRKRCAIYTRKSSEEGLEQEFNSLAAQREACEAYIRSQQHEGWVLDRHRYDDGGFSGGNLERPALQRLLADIRTSRSTWTNSRLPRLAMRASIRRRSVANSSGRSQPTSGAAWSRAPILRSSKAK